MGGTHIYPVSGHGYSLLWYEGNEERRRVDWSYGVVYSPPDKARNGSTCATSPQTTPT